MNKVTVYSFKTPPYFWRLLLMLPCLASHANSFAQSDTSRRLNEIKVNSYSIPAGRDIVPSQSVSATDFVKYNALNVADAIRNFSGVIIKDFGGIGGLKTMSVRGLGANHTAVLYDGIQINDAENGQVDLGKLNTSNIYQITLYNAQPPNILQTARAYTTSSVLAIETAKPNLSVEKPYQIIAGIKAGSFGLYNPYLQWQQRLSNSWAVVLNGYIQSANGAYGYEKNDGGVVSRQKRIGSKVAMQQIDGAINWNTTKDKLNIHINYFNSDRGVPGEVVQYRSPQTGQKLYNRDLFFQGRYEHRWSGGLQLLASSKFAQNQLFYFDPDFLRTGKVLDQHFSQREYYQSAALAYRLTEKWTVSYSADIALNNLNANLVNFRYPTRLTFLNVVAINITLGRWTLQGNLLNADIKETVKMGSGAPRYNIWAPTLIAAFKPFIDNNLQLKAFYKYAYRMPTFNDQYYNFISNPTLKPEYARQYNLGVSYTKSLSGLMSYITVTADGYYNYVTDKLVFVPTLYNGYTQNAGKVDIKGLDLGIKTALSMPGGYNFNLIANYSYQQALYVDDQLSDYLNRLPYIPLHTLAFNAGLTKGRIGVYYNQIVSSSRYYENNPGAAYLMPPYVISDATIVYKSQLSNFPVVLSAGVVNLFDKRYEVVRSYPMPGRSYRLSFQITI